MVDGIVGDVSRNLSEEQRAVWRTYIETSLRLETRLDDSLRSSTGLSMIDYHLLVLLSEAPGQRLRMGEVADRMVFSRSRATYQVDSMQKRGLVVRASEPGDGRASSAVLTAAGVHALELAAPLHAESIHELFLDELDDEDLHHLGDIFGRLRMRLQN